MTDAWMLGAGLTLGTLREDLPRLSKIIQRLEVALAVWLKQAKGPAADHAGRERVRVPAAVRAAWSTRAGMRAPKGA